MVKNVLLMSTPVKIINLLIALFLCSCSFLERDQGTYGAMIFKEPKFNKEQPQVLIKEQHISLWADKCGATSILNFDYFFNEIIKEYVKVGSEQIVGLANVHVKTYLYFIGISALPCMRIDAVPLVVKTRF